MNSVQNNLEQKAQKYAQKIIRLPFVRMVALTGSVAAGSATQRSDIDFLVITKPGRIYLTRAIVVLFVMLAGQYRTSKKVAGRICLNWFLPDNLAFDIDVLKIEFKLKIKNFKLSEDKIGRVKLLEQRDQEITLEKCLSGKFGNVLERLTKKYQIWRIKKDPRTHMSGSEVRWADDELGFHPPKIVNNKRHNS